MSAHAYSLHQRLVMAYQLPQALARKNHKADAVLNVSITQRIPTAIAANTTSIVKETKACSIIMSLAQWESTGVSVGEKAILVPNTRNRFLDSKFPRPFHALTED